MQSEVSDVEVTALSDNITFSTWKAHASVVQFFTRLQETGTFKGSLYWLDSAMTVTGKLLGPFPENNLCFPQAFVLFFFPEKGSPNFFPRFSEKHPKQSPSKAVLNLLIRLS